MQSRFLFEFDGRFRLPLRLIGVTPRTAYVDLGDESLLVRFGPWSLETPLWNIRGAAVTGPYRLWRAVGPRLSLTDHGVTFGTSAGPGVCIRFAKAVPALAPLPVLAHPDATVTVAEPERLVDALSALS